MHIECGGTIIEVNKKLNVVGIVRDVTNQVKTELIEIEIENRPASHGHGRACFVANFTCMFQQAWVLRLN